MANDFGITWNGGTVEKLFAKKAGRGLEKAAKKVARETRKLLKQQTSPPVSKPDEPPGRITGKLARSIRVVEEIRGQEYRIGHRKNVGYGATLELGSKRIAARPHLRPAFDKTKSKVVKMVAKG